MDRYRAEHGVCPDAQALGMTDGATVRLSSSGKGEAAFVLDAATPGSPHATACGFEMRFADVSPAADGKTLRFVSDAQTWDCRGGTLDIRYRPAPCR